jgi:phage gp16-like protein
MDKVSATGGKKSGPGKGVRNALLAKVHIAKKELGLKDPDYQVVLLELYNVESAKDLSDVQLDHLIRVFESSGWIPKDKHGNPRQRGQRRRPDFRPGTDEDRTPLMKKIEAQLAEIGRLENRWVPWAYAESILKRQGGGQYLNWASYDALVKVVQSLATHLKRIERRASGQQPPKRGKRDQV